MDFIGQYYVPAKFNLDITCLETHEYEVSAKFDWDITCMENWNGNHHIDDPDDTLEPWDDQIVEQRIVNAIEKEDETTKLIAKACAVIIVPFLIRLLGRWRMRLAIT